MTPAVVDLASVTANDFAPWVDSLFALELPNGASVVEIRLTRVSGPVRQSPDPTRRATFSVEFAGPPNIVLPQSMYRIAHPEMGVMDLFLVPIAGDAERRTYEAVFN